MRAPHCPAPFHLPQTPELGSHSAADGGEREAIEGGAHGGRVGAHGGEDQPVAHVQLGQLHLLQEELVKGIAHGAVEGAREEEQLGAEVLQGHGGGGGGIREGRCLPLHSPACRACPQGTRGKISARTLSFTHSDQFLSGPYVPGTVLDPAFMELML